MTQGRLSQLAHRFRLRCGEDAHRLSRGLAGTELHRTVHRIAGLAGTFGEGELGRRAAEIEDQLASGRVPESDSLKALADHLAQVGRGA